MKVSNSSLGRLLVVIFVCVAPVFAQSDRGGITGRVTDPNGAVVADAKVTAVNLETGDSREARTNGEGNYTIPQLAAVTYTVKVEAQGFKTASVENIKVAVQVIRTVDIILEVGEIANTLSGNAREEFGSDFQISVPTVVVGSEARLSQRNDSRNYAIPLNWHSETAYLLVALE